MELKVSKSKFLCLGMTSLMLLGILNGTGLGVYAAESDTEESDTEAPTSLWDIEAETNPIYDSTPLTSNLPENVTVDYTEEGPIVTVYDESADTTKLQSNRVARAAVSRWGGWEYTNIAISTGVLAGAINTGLSAGVGAVAGIVGLPAKAIGGLLAVSGWTEIGGAPGAAVAKQWDKNGNGWVGFYYQRGYDAAGKVVATRYKTE